MTATTDSPAQNYADNFCVSCQSAPCKDDAYGCSDDPWCLCFENPPCAECVEMREMLNAKGAK